MTILKATIFVKYTSVQHSSDLMALKFVQKGDKFTFVCFDVVDQESTVTSHWYFNYDLHITCAVPDLNVITACSLTSGYI